MTRIVAFAAFLMLTTCGSDDQIYRCNFLPNIYVERSINLNFPEYSQLNFNLTTVYIPDEGVKGVYVSNVGNNSYRAFDAADPSHAATSCSMLINSNGIVKCGCEDENEYYLWTGQAVNGDVQCVLKEYRVESGGDNILIISN